MKIFFLFLTGKSSPSRRSPQGNKKPRKGIHSSLFINQSMNFYSSFLLWWPLYRLHTWWQSGFQRTPDPPVYDRIQPTTYHPDAQLVFFLSILFIHRGCKCPFFKIGTAIVGQLDGVTETADRRVIEWKFGQLDQSGDGQLNRKEFRVLRRLVRKVVRPKRCTKNFPRLCDTDQDRKISRSEWSVCLGVGINSKSDLIYSKNKF